MFKYLVPILFFLFCSCTQKKQAFVDSPYYRWSKAQQDSIYVLADSFSNVGHAERATQYVCILVNIDPQNGKWWMLHGRIFGLLGSEDSIARYDFKKVLSLNYKKDVAYFSLALLELHRGNKQSAMIYLDSSLAENPNNSKSLGLKKLIESRN